MLSPTRLPPSLRCELAAAPWIGPNSTRYCETDRLSNAAWSFFGQARYCTAYLGDIGMPPDDVPRGVKSQETDPSFENDLTALDNVSRWRQTLNDRFINVA